MLRLAAQLFIRREYAWAGRGWGVCESSFFQGFLTRVITHNAEESHIEKYVVAINARLKFPEIGKSLCRELIKRWQEEPQKDAGDGVEAPRGTKRGAATETNEAEPSSAAGHAGSRCKRAAVGRGMQGSEGAGKASASAPAAKVLRGAEPSAAGWWS